MWLQQPFSSIVDLQFGQIFTLAERVVLRDVGARRHLPELLLSATRVRRLVAREVELVAGVQRKSKLCALIHL
jgi:hypothetical protein